jgi:hypothetical protein
MADVRVPAFLIGGALVVIVTATSVDLLFKRHILIAKERLVAVDRELAEKREGLARIIAVLPSVLYGFQCGNDLKETRGRLHEATAELQELRERGAPQADLAPVLDRIREYNEKLEMLLKPTPLSRLTMETVNEDIAKMNRHLVDLATEREALSRELYGFETAAHHRHLSE